MFVFIKPLKSKQEIKEEKEDADYEPTDMNEGNETPPSNIATRKSRYKADAVDNENNEVGI